MSSVHSIHPAMTDACTQTPFPGSEETLDRNMFVRSPPKACGKRAREDHKVCTLPCHIMARPASELRPTFGSRAGGALANPIQQRRQVACPTRRGFRHTGPHFALRWVMRLLCSVSCHQGTCHLPPEQLLLALLLGSPPCILGAEKCCPGPLVARRLLGLCCSDGLIAFCVHACAYFGQG